MRMVASRAILILAYRPGSSPRRIGVVPTLKPVTADSQLAITFPRLQHDRGGFADFLPPFVAMPGAVCIPARS